MTELRWILLAAGILLIAGLYVWGMRSRQRSAATPVERSVRVDPAPPVVNPGPGPASLADNPRVEPSFAPDDDFAPTTDEGEPPIDFDEPAISRSHGRREPTLGTETTVVVQRPAPSASFEVETDDGPAPERAPEPAVETPREAEPRAQQKIVAVRVVANPPLRFEGAKLLEMIRSEGLEFGRYEIFHNLHTDGRPIFSVASLREPGTFDIGAMPTSVYPGIALFAVLPGPLHAVETFDQLIFTARALAAQLGGTLADDRGGPLTVHRITRLREDMVAFDRQRSGGDAD